MVTTVTSPETRGSHQARTMVELCARRWATTRGGTRCGWRSATTGNAVRSKVRLPRAAQRVPKLDPPPTVGGVAH